MPEKDTVLVAGDCGFTAMHCILRLIEAGFQVRATVGSHAKGQFMRDVLARRGSAESLELFDADLTSDEGWHEAVQGCRFVLHVTSPLSAGHPCSNDTTNLPTRGEAIHLLRAGWASRLGKQRRQPQNR